MVVTDRLYFHDCVITCIVTPLPIVAISVGIRYRHYGVRDSCGDLL